MDYSAAIVAAPIIDENIAQTSPIMLNVKPAILPLFLYSLMPKTIPIIDVICPTNAKSQAKTIPIMPKTTAAFELSCTGA